MTYGVNAPRGLQAVSYGSSATWTGGIQVFNITPQYGTSLFVGDLVTFTNGQLVRYTAGGAAPAGVFLGCTFTDPAGIIQLQKYWPAGQLVKVGTYAVANVIVDPNTIFTIQSDAPFAWSNLDKNVDVTFATGGNLSTGDSGMQLDHTTIAATATLPLHVIAFDPIPGNVPTPGGTSVAYANVFVKLNNTTTNAGATGV
jgi:hypothetical protein